MLSPLNLLLFARLSHSLPTLRTCWPFHSSCSTRTSTTPASSGGCSCVVASAALTPVVLCSRMTEKDFLRNNRGIDNGSLFPPFFPLATALMSDDARAAGKDLPATLLTSLFNEIKKSEIKMETDDLHYSMRPDLKGSAADIRPESTTPDFRVSGFMVSQALSRCDCRRASVRTKARPCAALFSPAVCPQCPRILPVDCAP